MPELIATVTDDSFAAEVEESPLPYLVEFTSEWCAPCAALQPVLEEFAAEYSDKLRIGKVDIVAEPGATERFEVKTTPTMIVFQGGEPVKRMFGAKGKRQLTQELLDFIS